MRPKQPRIPPLSDAELSPEQRQAAGGGIAGGVLNIARTLMQHPALLKAWLPFAARIMSANSLAARDREILILRTGVCCDSAYELAQHTVIARQVGLSDREIASVKGDGSALTAFERTLLKAADELVEDHCISDTTWAALAERYTRDQLIELIFTVGNYTLVSMALNSLGVQIEPDVEKYWPTTS